MDVASDLPDNELLLQKHFTALLSAVWKVTPQSASQKNSSLLSSKSGLYFGGRFFSSRISQVSQKSARDAAGKPTSLVQTKKLLAAALHDATDNQKEKVSSSDKEEERSVVEDQLELTLQFQQQNDDSVPLPTALKLSIPIVDNLREGKDTGDSNLKSSRHVAESRFRYV